MHKAIRKIIQEATSAENHGSIFVEKYKSNRYGKMHKQGIDSPHEYSNESITWKTQHHKNGYPSAHGKDTKGNTYEIHGPKFGQDSWELHVNGKLHTKGNSADGLKVSAYKHYLKESINEIAGKGKLLAIKDRHEKEWTSNWPKNKDKSEAALKKYKKARSLTDRLAARKNMNESQKHIVSVTVSDPDHPMVTKRKEQVQKRIRVTADNATHATERAKAHYKKAGYKVHDANHVKIEEALEESRGYKYSLQISPKEYANFKAHSDTKLYDHQYHEKSNHLHVWTHKPHELAKDLEKVIDFGATSAHAVLGLDHQKSNFPRARLKEELEENTNYRVVSDSGKEHGKDLGFKSAFELAKKTRISTKEPVHIFKNNEKVHTLSPLKEANYFKYTRPGKGPSNASKAVKDLKDQNRETASKMGPFKWTDTRTEEEKKAEAEKNAKANAAQKANRDALKKEETVNESIKGWKNAHSDLMAYRKAQREAGMTVHVHSVKKDGTESKLHDARKSFETEERAREYHKRITDNNPGRKIRHNLYVDGKLKEKLGEEAINESHIDLQVYERATSKKLFAAKATSSADARSKIKTMQQHLGNSTKHAVRLHNTQTGEVYNHKLHHPIDKWHGFGDIEGVKKGRPAYEETIVEAKKPVPKDSKPKDDNDKVKLGGKTEVIINPTLSDSENKTKKKETVKEAALNRVRSILREGKKTNARWNMSWQDHLDASLKHHDEYKRHRDAHHRELSAANSARAHKKISSVEHKERVLKANGYKTLADMHRKSRNTEADWFVRKAPQKEIDSIKSDDFKRYLQEREAYVRPSIQDPKTKKWTRNPEYKGKNPKPEKSKAPEGYVPPMRRGASGKFERNPDYVSKKNATAKGPEKPAEPPKPKSSVPSIKQKTDYHHEEPKPEAAGGNAFNNRYKASSGSQEKSEQPHNDYDTKKKSRFSGWFKSKKINNAKAMHYHDAGRQKTAQASKNVGRYDTDLSKAVWGGWLKKRRAKQSQKLQQTNRWHNTQYHVNRDVVNSRRQNIVRRGTAYKGAI